VALNLIIACILIVNVLNVLLVLDLYGRTRTLAKMAHDASRLIVGINHLLRKVTDRETPEAK
jgi:hypothetical protein